MAAPGNLRKAPRCSATSKRTGLRCQAPAVSGWPVCRHHGAKKVAPPSKRIKSPLDLIESMRQEKWWRTWDAADEVTRLRTAQTIAKRLVALEKQRLDIKTPIPEKRIASAPWTKEKWAKFGALVEAKRPIFEIAIMMGISEGAVRARKTEWLKGRRESKPVVGRKPKPETAERWRGLGPMIEAGASAKEIAQAYDISPSTARKEKSRWLKKMGKPTRPPGRQPRANVEHYPGALRV